MINKQTTLKFSTSPLLSLLHTSNEPQRQQHTNAPYLSNNQHLRKPAFNIFDSNQQSIQFQAQETSNCRTCWSETTSYNCSTEQLIMPLISSSLRGWSSWGGLEIKLEMDSRRGRTQSDTDVPVSYYGNNDLFEIKTSEIHCWKLKKAEGGGLYAVYVINVCTKANISWTIEKRYQEFRKLREEIKRVAPPIAGLSFPKKNWFFNLTTSVLQLRKELLDDYLKNVIAYRAPHCSLSSPHLQEISELFTFNAHTAWDFIFSSCDHTDIFLQVVDNVAPKQNSRLSRLFSSRHSISSGLVQSIVSVHDFKLIKVLGQGRCHRFAYHIKPCDSLGYFLVSEKSTWFDPKMPLKAKFTQWRLYTF